jgi:predicted amidohydrolase YtcJ
MIVDNGIKVGLDSDGMQVTPMNPWVHAYYATMGRNALGNVINAGQQITREEVLRLHTPENGWFTFDEYQLGSIEAGKLGDLVVLNEDYFAVPDERLERLRSVLTVVGGKLVHDEGVLGTS